MSIYVFKLVIFQLKLESDKRRKKYALNFVTALHETFLKSFFIGILRKRYILKVLLPEFCVVDFDLHVKFKTSSPESFSENMTTEHFSFNIFQSPDF